jgi:hypothetical protein
MNSSSRMKFFRCGQWTVGPCCMKIHWEMEEMVGNMETWFFFLENNVTTMAAIFSRELTVQRFANGDFQSKCRKIWKEIAVHNKISIFLSWLLKIAICKLFELKRWNFQTKNCHYLSFRKCVKKFILTSTSGIKHLRTYYCWEEWPCTMYIWFSFHVYFSFDVG